MQDTIWMLSSETHVKYHLMELEMLFQEIYSDTFSYMAFMSLFSLNNHKWKLFVLKCISHKPLRHRTDHYIELL
jgi:hypothetical protein